MTTTEVVRPPARFWSTIREALHGSQQDFTQGSIPRAIVLLAIPMVLEMVMESIFAVTDIFFVGRLGPSAVATVVVTESFIFILYAAAMGLAIGATALIARRIGEHDTETASLTAVQAIVIGLALSVVIGVSGFTVAPWLLAVMGADNTVITTGSWFARVMLGGSGTVLMLFLLNAIFRGSGDAAISMRVLWLANGINILLGPCLIFGLGPFPHLGLVGAATATTIGRGTGVLFAFSRLIRPGRRVTVRRRHLKFDPQIMLRIVKLSGSGAFQSFVGTASWIGVLRIMSTFGSEALAGYGIAFRIVMFGLLPCWGVSNAAATMVGQALGAKKPDRAERSVWFAAAYSCGVLTLVGLTFAILATPIVGFFTKDPGVLQAGSTGLRAIAFGFPLYAYGMTVTQSFNGAGDTWTPTWINVGVFWAFEIPLAYFLAVRANFGPPGVFYALTTSFSVLAVVSILLFRRGKWKKVAL